MTYCRICNQPLEHGQPQVPWYVTAPLGSDLTKSMTVDSGTVHLDCLILPAYRGAEFLSLLDAQAEVRAEELPSLHTQPSTPRELMDVAPEPLRVWPGEPSYVRADDARIHALCLTCGDQLHSLASSFYDGFRQVTHWTHDNPAIDGRHKPNGPLLKIQTRRTI